MQEKLNVERESKLHCKEHLGFDCKNQWGHTGKAKMHTESQLARGIEAGNVHNVQSTLLVGGRLEKCDLD